MLALLAKRSARNKEDEQRRDKRVDDHHRHRCG
jgi:hypothetical protein